MLEAKAERGRGAEAARAAAHLGARSFLGEAGHARDEARGATFLRKAAEGEDGAAAANFGFMLAHGASIKASRGFARRRAARGPRARRGARGLLSGAARRGRRVGRHQGRGGGGAAVPARSAAGRAERAGRARVCCVQWPWRRGSEPDRRVRLL